MPDHAHIFVGFKPSILISDLVNQIKVASNDFINEKKLANGKFNWQRGSGVFSYSHSQIDSVIKYVQKQEAHHRQGTFREEYDELLIRFGIPFDEKYLFDFIQV